MKKMIDLHMHIIPAVDDGAKTPEMSEQMLKMAAAQGVEAVIATSHSDAFLEADEYVQEQYDALLRMVKEKEIPIKLYLGCEVLCDAEDMTEVLWGLEKGILPSLNGSKYVLTEMWYVDAKEAETCMMALMKKGWIPVIAHAERLGEVSVEEIRALKEKGCLVQVNAYSIAEEKNAYIRNKALSLLEEGLVDFIGSDAHRSDHRPPAVEKGMEYLYEHFDKKYVDDILYNNAKRLILCEETEMRG